MIRSDSSIARLPGTLSAFYRWEPHPPNSLFHRIGEHGRPQLTRRTTFVHATFNLLDVYKRVTPGFDFQRTVPRRCLTNPSELAPNSNFDNESHDLVLRVDDNLLDQTTGDEYIVVDLLGTGTFGQVVKCQHKQSATFRAVKIVKNQQAYFNQAWVEINILRILHRNNSSDDAQHIVRFMTHFIFRDHLCLVFEKLSINLYELLKQNRYAGVSMEILRSFLQQLLKALDVLVKSEVVHCDVKPENILLSAVDKAELKLIDFGSACQLQHPVYTYVQSRFYRSPEILLGLPSYDSKIDMWSLGCVAGELFLGIPMFPGQDEMNMLCRITEMLGDFPDMFLRRCLKTRKFFSETRSGDDIQMFHLKSVQQYEEENDVTLSEWKRYFKEERLRDIIMACTYQSQFQTVHEVALRESFIDLLGGMLTIDPVDRWTPSEALQHPFITSGPLPNGQPWHPSGRLRRHVPRSRPLLIDGSTGGMFQDTPYSASAPNFAANGLFSVDSSQDTDRGGPGYAGPGPHMVGTGSYIPGPSFPAFRTSMTDVPTGFEDNANFLSFSGTQEHEGTARRRAATGTVMNDSTTELNSLPDRVGISNAISPRTRGWSQIGDQSSEFFTPGISRNLRAVHQSESPHEAIMPVTARVHDNIGNRQDSSMVEMEDSVFAFLEDEDLRSKHSPREHGDMSATAMELSGDAVESSLDVSNNEMEPYREVFPTSNSSSQRPPLHGRTSNRTRVHPRGS